MSDVDRIRAERAGPVRSLLVTNDFPPKTGGIQSYLWELWRRLPPGASGVVTTPWEGAEAFDAEQPFPVARTPETAMFPTARLARRIRELARAWSVELLFVDPALPLGLLAPSIGLPYVVVAHGAEVTVYGRIPGSATAMRRVLRRAAGVVAAGTYPAAEVLHAARRDLPGVVVPPGVDTERFRPLDAGARAEARRRHGLDPDAPLVLGVSRLVPRKGIDVVIDAVARLPGVHLAVAGDGRDRSRLERRVRQRGVSGRVRFLGRVPDAELPALYGSADVFAMACRDRWAGLEREGFGIVFLEAAACGVPSVAGRSGGSHEAVVDGETGYVVDPRDVLGVARRIHALLADEDLRCAMGRAARRRATEELEYGHLAATLRPVALGDVEALGSLRAAIGVEGDG